MATSETWVPIRGYEGMYEVSDFGRVRSVERVVKRGNGQMSIKSRIIKPSCQRYPNVGLAKGGVRKKANVHRLVAEAFVPNPLNLPCVNHKDGCKTNNAAANLEWCTFSENRLHAERSGLTVSVGRKKRPVMRGDGMRFESATDAATFMGLHKTTILAAIRGEQNTAGGFTWEYAL